MLLFYFSSHTSHFQVVYNAFPIGFMHDSAVRTRLFVMKQCLCMQQLYLGCRVDTQQ